MTRPPVPILTDAVQAQIEDALAMFVHRDTWHAWGLDALREQGAALLFIGPPGTGKTITARAIARRLNAPLRVVDFAEIGSGTPGQNARNLRQAFRLTGGKRPVVFIDEADSLLVNRARLGNDLLWMLEFVNELLSLIGNYPGLVILCTNAPPEFLDSALDRRLLATVRFDVPDFETRCRIWREKWPVKMPVEPSLEDWKRLATFELTGAQIETCIILWAGSAIRTDRLPDVADLFVTLQSYLKNHDKDSRAV